MANGEKPKTTDNFGDRWNTTAENSAEKLDRNEMMKKIGNDSWADIYATADAMGFGEDWNAFSLYDASDDEIEAFYKKSLELQRDKANEAQGAEAGQNAGGNATEAAPSAPAETTPTTPSAPAETTTNATPAQESQPTSNNTPEQSATQQPEATAEAVEKKSRRERKFGKAMLIRAGAILAAAVTAFTLWYNAHRNNVEAKSNKATTESVGDNDYQNEDDTLANYEVVDAATGIENKEAEATTYTAEYTAGDSTEKMSSTFTLVENYDKSKDGFYADGKVSEHNFTARTYDINETSDALKCQQQLENGVQGVMESSRQGALWNIFAGAENAPGSIAEINSLAERAEADDGLYAQMQEDNLGFFSQVAHMESGVIKAGTSYSSEYEYVDADGNLKLDTDHDTRHDYDVRYAKIFDAENKDLLNDNLDNKKAYLSAVGLDAAHPENYTLVWSAECNQIIAIMNVSDVAPNIDTSIDEVPDAETPEDEISIIPEEETHIPDELIDIIPEEEIVPEEETTPTPEKEKEKEKDAEKIKERADDDTNAADPNKQGNDELNPVNNKEDDTDKDGVKDYDEFDEESGNDGSGGGEDANTVNEDGKKVNDVIDEGDKTDQADGVQGEDENQTQADKTAEDLQKNNTEQQNNNVDEIKNADQNADANGDGELTLDEMMNYNPNAN